MAKVYINTKAVKIVNDRFLKQANLKISSVLNTAVNRAIPKIKAEMTQMLLIKLKTGVVYRGLIGEDAFSSRPLRAEFGLTDSMAEAAANRLVELFEESVKEPTTVDEKTARSTRIIINLRAFDVAGTKQKLMRAPEFRHDNPGGTIDAEIAWMEWLLTGVADIFDSYGIKYGLSPKEEARSRSGQAIMIFDPYVGRYQVPDRLLPRGSAENFIEEVANDKQLIGRMKSMAIATINVEIARLRR